MVEPAEVEMRVKGALGALGGKSTVPQLARVLAVDKFFVVDAVCLLREVGLVTWHGDLSDDTEVWLANFWQERFG